MSQATTSDHRWSRSYPGGRSSPLEAQTDALIDSITGAGREQLEGLPVPMVFDRLCAQLRAMGLEPAEAKVLRVARWIAETDASDQPTGVHAA